MTQLDGKSMNVIEQNIEKLKEIFPEVFSEGKIDFSKLEEELGTFKEDANERYNFTWNGKSEAKKIALTPSTGTLRPCKEESKDWDTTKNLYIEGDNLEVLKLLQKSYHKKVKMIYIDPPYNTGKDFVYKDNFRDNIKNYLEITGQVDSDGNKLSTNSETSGRYHSDWLNMMYPRLKLARNLLKDDGVIFISIDDNEVANLRKLCDEIFGEDNFVGEITIQSNPRGSQASNFFASVDESLLCFAKNTSCLEIRGYLKDLESESGEYNLTDDNGKQYRLLGLRQRGGAWRREDRPKMYYPIYVNPLNGEVSLEKSEKYSKESLPKRPTGEDSRWTWGIETFNKDKHKLVGKKVNREGNDDFYDIFRKDYLENEDGEIKATKPKTIWDDKEINYQNGRNDIKNLFQNSEIFDFPKPVFYLEKIITMFKMNNDIILDFFSGSATTAHAVMKLNSEDDRNRKFICVQLPETTDEKSEAYKAGYKNICEIGKERIRRAGEKVKSEIGKDELDIGFKVLKLDSSNIKSWDSDFENLEENLLDVVENIKSDRSEEDLLYEILLKYGLDLTLPIEEKEVNGKKLFNIGFGALIICLDSNISIDITDEIIAIKKEHDSVITRVVFKDSGFKNATEKTNIIKTLNQNGIDEVVSV
ncbi:site-specific DNA-methyltransferase [Aliarcobacter butzleri]|uniref:site-specific DNA-methyltransferase n=1 Tax=Aliarcobacter butzleri TaxID=28197 RepID=UPI00125F072D|nr:site-specific DNA-methyltransferase [Aliarcobacter butzleri]